MARTGTFAQFMPSWRERLGKVFARHGFIGLCTGGGFLIEFATRVVLARSLGPDAFGTFTLGLSVMMVGLVFATLGTPTAAARQLAFHSALNHHAVVRGIVRTSAKISLAGGVVVALLLGVGYWIHDFGHPRSLLYFVAAIPVAALLRLSAESLRGLHHFKSAILSQEVLRRGLPFCMVGLAVFCVLGLAGVTVMYLAGLALACLVSWILLTRLLSEHGVETTPCGWGAVLATSIPLAGSAILVVLNLRVEFLLLGVMGSSTDVGTYGAAQALSQLLIFPSQVLLFGLIPRMTSQLARKTGGKVAVSVRRVVGRLAVINLVLGGLLVFFAADLLTLFGGAEYTAGASTLRILAVGYGFLAATWPCGHGLVVRNQTLLFLYANAISFVLRLATGILLIPAWGPVGAAVGALVGMIGLGVSCMCMLRASEDG